MQPIVLCLRKKCKNKLLYPVPLRVFLPGWFVKSDDYSVSKAERLLVEGWGALSEISKISEEYLKGTVSLILIIASIEWTS
jgi:hypothetical protein